MPVEQGSQASGEEGDEPENTYAHGLGSWNGEGAGIFTRLSYASYRCNYSYALDTQNDSDLYDLQKVSKEPSRE